MRSILIAIGNLLYHFDKALFGLLVPFLAPIFFPEMDPVSAMIYMYAIHPICLFVKPLGALFFGRLGERIGKRNTLSITLLGMSILTGATALLPSYNQIGYLAPAALGFIRLGIGFFSAGETAAGAILLLEKQERAKRGFISSLFDASGILGVLIASFCITSCHTHPMFWRFLFASGSIIGAVAWLLRRGDEYEEKTQNYQVSSLQVLWEHRRAVLSIACVAGFSYANYYLITHFLNGFLPIVSNLTNADAVSLNSLLLLLDLSLLPFFGVLSLKVKKELLIGGGILAVMVFAAPLFLLLHGGGYMEAAFVRILLTVFGVSLAAPFHAWAYERAPLEHRYLVTAVGTAIGIQVFGAPIPSLGLWLYTKTGLVFAPTIPVILIGFAPLISLFKNQGKERVTSSHF